MLIFTLLIILSGLALWRLIALTALNVPNSNDDFIFF
jgi:hypothetical protein